MTISANTDIVPGMKLKDSETAFAALSDATRLRILHLLSAGELCVCDLMTVLKEPQSKISRHLGYLRGAKLVEARKEGLWMYYRLSKPSAKIFRTILGSLGCCSDDFDELKKDLKELRKAGSCLVSCCK